jgi:hypothetical protein
MPHPPLGAETVARTKIFYSTAQFGATCLCGAWDPTFAFAPLYAIQLAPFLMTLERKGRLATQGYHLFYILALLVPYVAGFAARETKGALFLALGGATTLAGCLRRGRCPRLAVCALAAILAGAAPRPLAPDGGAGALANGAGGLATGVALATKAPLLFLYCVPPGWAEQDERWAKALGACRWARFSTPVLFCAMAGPVVALSLCSAAAEK